VVKRRLLRRDREDHPVIGHHRLVLARRREASAARACIALRRQKGRTEENRRAQNGPSRSHRLPPPLGLQSTRCTNVPCERFTALFAPMAGKTGMVATTHRTPVPGARWHTRRSLTRAHTSTWRAAHAAQCVVF